MYLLVKDSTVFEKVFISYSWDGEEHQQWTKNLADRLEEINELTVSFDQYDLDSLSDKNYFMEKAVFETDLILAVITGSYNDKANNRKDGVGIETSMAVSRHWEEAVGSGKSNIIPILREGAAVPNYLKNKFYIDFRNDSDFENLGTAMTWLFPYWKKTKEEVQYEESLIDFSKIEKELEEIKNYPQHGV